MKILITGANGFVGRNLCSQLINIKEGKAKCYDGIKIDEVFEYDLGNTQEDLDYFCKESNFVFNLAGVNRAKNQYEFMQENFGFANTLLETLKVHKNSCPVMLSSSAQASLTGRFGNSEYGLSKKAGEDLFIQYGQDVKARILIYRFPNIFGKWCRPNYNSAIATFCNNIANDLPININDSNVEIELLYIDDLVDEMIAALLGKENRCEFNGLNVIPSENGRFCYCPITHKTSLGKIVEIIMECAKSINPSEGKAQIAMAVPHGSLEYKLMSTYLSYLPNNKAIVDLKMNIDHRGSFTELIQTLHNGQVSINIIKPGITKGEHWHHSKWETFIVVAGNGLVQQRKEGTDEVWNFELSGEKIQAVHILPGYTHNITNLSNLKDLVIVMYCNEVFNPNRADTYFDPVEKNKCV